MSHRTTANAAPPAADRSGTAAAAPLARTDPAALRGWDGLADAAASPNPFFEAWYLGPALDRLATDRVAVIAVGAVDHPAGLVPLERARNYYGRPVPHWRAWSHGNCFLGLPLVRRGEEAAFWRALLAYADRHAWAELFLHLPLLPLDDPVTQALRAVCAEQRRPAAVVWQEERALLASSDDPETYFDGAVSAKKRKELRRQLRRLEDLGTLAVDRRHDADGIGDWARTFLALEARGWKGAAGSALANDPRNAAVFEAALQGAADRGRLERLALTLDGRAVAMLVTFLCPPGAFSYKTAYDEDLARFSPGVLLQRENLGLLARDGIAWCDSCAAADHPMIDHMWRERRRIGHVSVALGGAARRGAFRAFAAFEGGETWI